MTDYFNIDTQNMNIFYRNVIKKRHKILNVFINAVFVWVRNVKHVSYTITYRTSLRIDIFVMRGTLIMLFILNIQNMSARNYKLRNIPQHSVSEFLGIVEWKQSRGRAGRSRSGKYW